MAATKTSEPPPGTEPLLTAAQVGAWLGYSADTVYRLMRAEGLPCRRMLGSRVKFLRSEVQAWLDARRTVIRTEATGDAAAEATAAPVPRAAGGLTGAEMLAQIRAAGKSGG